MDGQNFIVRKRYWVDRRLGMIGVFEKMCEDTGAAGFRIEGSNFPYLKDHKDGLVYFNAVKNEILIAPAEITDNEKRTKED